MIDLYTWHTPKWKKGVHYARRDWNGLIQFFQLILLKTNSFNHTFLKFLQTNRIPAIIDKDNNNYSLFESGAILMYLAEKSGKLINKSNSDEYFRTMEWLMWQMGGVGPMFGQVHHFVKL